MASWRPPRPVIPVPFSLPPSCFPPLPSSIRRRRRRFPKVKATRSNSRGCSRCFSLRGLFLVYSASKLHFQLQLPRLLPVETRPFFPLFLSLSFLLFFARSSFNLHPNSLVSFRLFSRIYFTYASKRTHVAVRVSHSLWESHRVCNHHPRTRRVPSIDNSCLRSLIDSSIRKSEVMGVLNLVLN